MIDKHQLEQLGWSKQLIDEVTRSSKQIKEYPVEYEGSKGVLFTNGSHSTDSAFYEAPNIDASTKITFNTAES